MRIRGFAKALAAAVTAVFLLSITQAGLCAASATPLAARTKRPEETALRYTPVPEVTPAVAEPVATPTPSASAVSSATTQPKVLYPTAAPNEGERLDLLYRSAMACGVAGVVLLGIAIAMPKKQKKAKRSSPRSAAKKPSTKRKRA